MKKIILILFTVIMLSTLGHSMYKSHKYKDVNIKNAITCENITEQFIIPNTESGIIFFILRIKQCAGVDDLFTIGWRGENSKAEQTVAKLHTLLFSEKRNVKLELLKTDSDKNQNPALNVNFYILTEKENK